MRFNGASLLIELLKRQGIEIVAGIPGGVNLPLYDALGQSTLRHILSATSRRGGSWRGHGAVHGKRWASFLRHLGTGRRQPPDGHRGCEARFGPHRRRHGAGRLRADRDRRIPGGRHLRNEHTGDEHVPSSAVSRSSSKSSRRPSGGAVGKAGPVLIDLPKDVQQAVIDLDELPPRCPRCRPRG